MASWIHCNKCSQHFDVNVPLYIVECGHMECQNCLKTGIDDGKCSICNKTCNRMLLSKDMKYDIQMYFKPFPSIIDNMKKVYEFQAQQHNSLLNKLFSKYNRAKKEYLKCQKVIESQRRDIMKLTSMLKVTQSPSGNFRPMPSSKHFISSTPMSKGSGDMSLSLSTVYNSAIRSSCARPGYVQRVNVTPQNQTFLTSSSGQVVPGSKSSTASSIGQFPRNDRGQTMFSPMIHFPYKRSNIGNF